LPQSRLGPRKGAEAEFITKLVGRIVREWFFLSTTTKGLGDADLEIDAHLSTFGDDTMTTITMTPKLQAALIRLRDADAKLRVTPTPTGIIRVAETKQAETTYINAYQAWITAAETVSKIIK
jgi:hypothetical protein